MFRVVYEVVLAGAPEELDCISRLGDAIKEAGGECVGSHTMFLCALGETLVKVTPHLAPREGAPYPPPPTQVMRGLTVALSTYLVIEGRDPRAVVEVVSRLYAILRGCGLSVRLVEV